MHFHFLLTYVLEHQDKLLQTSRDDLSVVVRAIRSESAVSNTITKDFIASFRSDYEPKIDALDMDFFSLGSGARKEQLTKMFGSSQSDQLLVHFLAQANYREVQSFVSDVYASFGADMRVVQITTPRPLDTDTKQAVRAHYTNDGVVFYIDKKLVGGIMMYADGTIVDKSFSSLLSRITKLTT